MESTSSFVAMNRRDLSPTRALLLLQLLLISFNFSWICSACSTVNFTCLSAVLLVFKSLGTSAEFEKSQKFFFGEF